MMENVINQKIAALLREVERNATSDKAAREVAYNRLERLLQWRDNFEAAQ